VFGKAFLSLYSIYVKMIKVLFRLFMH